MKRKLGKLRIYGNPSIELGDIKLSIREKGSPVRITPGTKDLVLITALDKEGIEGPASVYVNVICDRKHLSDPVSTRKNKRFHLIKLNYNSNAEYNFSSDDRIGTIILLFESFHFLIRNHFVDSL